MLRITGGKVYDPANGIDGQVRDIASRMAGSSAEVEGGRTIDATGMIVFPAAWTPTPTSPAPPSISPGR